MNTLFIFPENLIGLLPVTCGIFLNIWTELYLRQYHTTVKTDKIPSTVIKTGPFRISRHPMYQGMELILLGEAILFGSIVLFIIPILFYILIEKIFISSEEQTLLTWFPKEYNDYKNQVRRWM